MRVHERLPFYYCSPSLRGCSGTPHLFHDGQNTKSFPRGRGGYGTKHDIYRAQREDHRTKRSKKEIKDTASQDKGLTISEPRTHKAAKYYVSAIIHTPTNSPA